jgi:hypothetical protein
MSNPKVKIAKGEVTFIARAEILDQKGIQGAIALFVRTYGKSMMESRYPRKDAAVEIPLP